MLPFSDETPILSMDAAEWLEHGHTVTAASEPTSESAVAEEPGETSLPRSPQANAATLPLEPNQDFPTSHPRFYIFEDNVTIVVENVAFRIPSYPLVRDSPKLKGLLHPETTIAATPIVLNGVSVCDFECFLTVIFQSSYTFGYNDRKSYAPLDELKTVEEWTSVLKLATEWEVAAVRDFAIRRLYPIASPVEKIVLARKYAVPGWLINAHLALCFRDHGPTDEEVAKLPLPDLVGIFRVRELARPRGIGWAWGDIEASIKHEVDVTVPKLHWQASYNGAAHGRFASDESSVRRAAPSNLPRGEKVDAPFESSELCESDVMELESDQGEPIESIEDRPGSPAPSSATDPRDPFVSSPNTQSTFQQTEHHDGQPPVTPTGNGEARGHKSKKKRGKKSAK